MKFGSTRSATYLLAVVTICFGCGDGSTKHQPTALSAREALDGALSAWKNGQAPESLLSQTPAVQVTDTRWRESQRLGNRLENFEILKEESGEGDQRFTVRLTFDRKKAANEPTVETTYVLVGRDPILVYELDDYVRFVNMEDNPRPKTKGARKR